MATIPFKTRQNHITKVFSPSGSKFADTYTVEIDDFGHKNVLKSGQTNIYELTQVDAELCEIENIIARVNAGDTSLLQIRNGQYIDTTEMPKTLAEAQNTILRLKTEFERLPVSERAKFEHNPDMYVAQYGTELWADKLGIKKPTLEVEDLTVEKEPIKLEKGTIDNE